MTAAAEAAAKAELLENVIATAQRLVKAEKDRSKITPRCIAEKVQKVAEMFASDSPLRSGPGQGRLHADPTIQPLDG